MKYLNAEEILQLKFSLTSDIYYSIDLNDETIKKNSEYNYILVIEKDSTIEIISLKNNKIKIKINDRFFKINKEDISLIKFGENVIDNIFQLIEILQIIKEIKKEKKLQTSLDLPLSIEQPLPSGQSQLPLSNEPLPLMQSQLPLSSEPLPLSQSQLSLSSEPLPSVQSQLSLSQPSLSQPLPIQQSPQLYKSKRKSQIKKLIKKISELENKVEDLTDKINKLSCSSDNDDYQQKYIKYKYKYLKLNN